MSDATRLHGGLTRRSFLKTTGVVAGASMAVGTAMPAPKALAKTQDTGSNKLEEQIYSGACRPNCFSGCKLNVHVRDGKVVKTSKGKYPDPAIDRICLRGLTHPLRMYDPSRLKYPMKRVGERGGDQWERISWDDAISDIAQGIQDIQKEFGPQAFSHWFVSGQYGLAKFQSMYKKLFNILNSSFINPSVDIGNMAGVNRVFGWGAGNWVSNEASDYVNAKTLFAWGNNITDAQVQEWHFVAEAIKGGTKFVVIDPVFTQAASKADLWVPIKPGTDAALVLAMMYVHITEKLIDEEYMKAHTVAPFLVRSDTGLFLRRSDFGIAPTPTGKINPQTKAEILDDPAMVLSSDGSPASVREAANPLVSGTYDFEGVPCRTAYDLLKDEVMKYPPVEASVITDVPEERIVELAHLAADGPVTHRLGWGSQSYLNGVHPSHAGASMAGLLGQVGFPGAGFGAADVTSYAGINSALVAEEGASKSPTVTALDFPEVAIGGKYLGKDFPIKGVFIFAGNPVSAAADTNAILEAFSHLDLIVTVDSSMTDTARYSDYVLPCAHWFEQEDITAQSQTRYLVYSEKAVDPLYESKTDSEICCLLAGKLGLGDSFKRSYSEWLEALFDTPLAASQGITYQRIKEEKAVRWTQADPFIAWEGNRFLTPSGRVEFYAEKPLLMGVPDKDFDISRERLPRYFPPAEATEESPLYDRYPLILLSERSRFRVHSQWYENKWLRELDPEPTVKINPLDAKKRGIGSGDYVECFNDRGHCVAKAVLSEASRPGTMVYAKNWQMSQHKAGSWSELSQRAYEPAACNTGFMDVLVDVRLWNEEG